MCKTNSAHSICGKPLSSVLEKEAANKRYSLSFCPVVRGAIVIYLLEIADSAEKQTGEKPGFDKMVLDNGQYLWELVTICNLNFGRQDKSATKDYNRLVMPKFRERVRWIQRKMIEYGALVKTPNGWAREPGRRFANAEEAGLWLDNKLTLASTPTASSAQPFQAQGIQNSMWNRGNSIPTVDDPLPEMGQLCLNDDSTSSSFFKDCVPPDYQARSRVETWMSEASVASSARHDQMEKLAAARHNKWTEMQEIDRQFRALRQP